jgi:hypothetical protein
MSDLLQFMVTKVWESTRTESTAAQPMEMAF